MNNFAEFIISGCKLEESAEHTFVEYMPPHVLHAFLELTVNSHQTKVNQTIVQRIHELHTNITKHFDDNGDEWCVNALGIAAEVRVFVHAFVCVPPSQPVD